MNDPNQTIDQAERTAGRPVAPAPSAMPQRVGRYRVEKVLGQGGFGLVYLAQDEQLSRLVAIKVPHPRLVAGADGAEAYLTEARTVANLDNPGIVTVFDVGSTELFPCFIVSKYIDGIDLGSRLLQSRLPLDEAVELVAAAAEALHYAHQQGIVHRDIKPGNILLDRGGKPFVADFGLALREQDVGKGPRFAGTPSYMSPEQARGEGHRVDGRSDIFSLGVVLYELLTGQKPFRADSRDELLEQIVRAEVRPPRQIDDHIPKELDRICLKALSKRAAERYSTAKDFADDLRYVLAGAAVAARTTGRDPERHEADAVLSPLNLPPTASGQQVVKIVPKGLRSFDAHDADFFLELLPGPRDREGLPESLRFWKHRIEETDPDRTFAVGLLYGPSGCGKSSLVKAGLLPRLGPQVTAVYAEAAAGETETRLLKGLRKYGPDLPAEGLAEAVAALRRGRGLPSGRKMLLVLDQFEQWLHANPVVDNTELVRALRQCDGARVQCLLLVRDDFGMAITRLMAALDLPLVQGQNFATVDLFDLPHAHKVLAEFGRSLASLPKHPAALSRDQESFLDRAVAGLSQEGRVVCVRLALFAEMIKGRPWTPATLTDVGGTEGLGVNFLEETFGPRAAHPGHRLHQRAAQEVLKSLLPESGTDIKGNMRSHQQLLTVSGYVAAPAKFADLLRILDGEMRLITPTESEGEGVPGEQPAGEKYYQLTHDYLVPSLRGWLTRKQRETRRGRAELRLAERAAAWTAKPEARHLPAWWEWANIRLFTRPKDWTELQRKMMRQAARSHGLRLAALLVLLTLLTWGVWEKYGALRGADLVRALAAAETADVPKLVAEMGPYRRWADPLLAKTIAASEPGSKEHLHAALALVPVDAGQVDYLADRLLEVRPEEMVVLRNALLAQGSGLAPRYWAVLRDRQAPAGRRLRAACALAAYDPEGEGWQDLAADVVDALVRENLLLVGDWAEALQPVGGRLIPPLTGVFRDTGRSESERSLATNLLADYAANQPEVLADLLADADPRGYAVLFPRLAAYRERALAQVRAELDRTADDGAEDADKERLAKRQANAAVTLLRLGQGERIWPLLRHRPDPRLRSYLIHRLGPLGADAATLLKRLAEEPDVSARRALLLSLGEFGTEALPETERAALVPGLLKLYCDEPDAGLRGAAEWLLRQWRQDDQLKALDEEMRQRDHDIAQQGRRPPGGRRWYVNGQSQTLVLLVDPPEFLMGSPPTEVGRFGGPYSPVEGQHRRRIGRSFAIATKEVTVLQFLRFRADHEFVGEIAPTPKHPVNAVNWYDVAAYCNWLSQVEGIPQSQWCYLPNDKGEFGPGMRMKPDWLSLTGYRLPTEAEWELSCRAGTVTARYHGETEELLGQYAWYSKNSQDRAMLLPGSLKPNDLGLFDMLGDAIEWCQDRYFFYPGGEHGGPVSDNGDERDIKSIDDNASRVLRGGAYASRPQNVRSALRYMGAGPNRNPNAGFRPARTFR